MDVALFDYYLPPDLIAQEPLPDRSAARMLLVPRSGALVLRDLCFRCLPDLLNPGDCVILNDTRVIPARLIGQRPTGGTVEVLLLHATADDLWEALVRPAARLRTGATVSFGHGELTAQVVAMGPSGQRTLRLQHEGDLLDILEHIGQVPLPPYIRRPQLDPRDRARYQTVYASRPGAVAAPTAGLHFTKEMLAALQARGVRIATVTLHVGLGTFQPVRATTVEQHRMHPEWCEVGVEAARLIAQTRRDGGRVVAVGTTAVRALESHATESGEVRAGAGLTNLFIYPGYRFRVVDALLTNFHLPRSTLLIMVSAFAGRERILAAYQHAIVQRYRFYSYGDCMLIL